MKNQVTPLKERSNTQNFSLHYEWQQSITLAFHKHKPVILKPLEVRMDRLSIPITERKIGLILPTT